MRAPAALASRLRIAARRLAAAACTVGEAVVRLQVIALAEALVIELGLAEFPFIDIAVGELAAVVSQEIMTAAGCHARVT